MKYCMVDRWEGDQHITELLEADGLETRDTLKSPWRVIPAQQLDGQPVFLGIWPTSRATELGLLDGDSLEIIHSWSVPESAEWMAGP